MPILRLEAGLDERSVDFALTIARRLSEVAALAKDARAHGATAPVELAAIAVVVPPRRVTLLGFRASFEKGELLLHGGTGIPSASRSASVTM